MGGFPLTADVSTVARVNNLPRILEAISRAIREAVLAHKRAGNPVAVWRDGQVVWLQPEEIPDEDEAE